VHISEQVLVSAPVQLPTHLRVVALIETALGVLFVTSALLLLLLSFLGRNSYYAHGGVPALFYAFLTAPIGLSFLLAARAIRHRWRCRSLLQFLPILSPIAAAPFFMWLF
jgi:hypothetical protein